MGDGRPRTVRPEYMEIGTSMFAALRLAMPPTENKIPADQRVLLRALERALAHHNLSVFRKHFTFQDCDIGRYALELQDALGAVDGMWLHYDFSNPGKKRYLIEFSERVARHLLRDKSKRFPSEEQFEELGKAFYKQIRRVEALKKEEL